MNYTKSNHRNPQDEGTQHGTTIHLSRILLFLRMHKDKSFTVTEIKANCCMNGRLALNSLNFLVKEKFVSLNEREYKGRKGHSTKVFSINIK